MKRDLIKSGVKQLFKKPFYSLYLKRMEKNVGSWQLPKHIGIVLDGNRRYAKQEKMGHVIKGHEKGADKLDELLNWCYEYNIPVITVWIFSLDNFQRSEEEVSGLFRLIEKRTQSLMENPDIYEKQVKLRYIGRTNLLPDSLQETIAEAEKKTASHQSFTLNIAIAYGGREEITDAVRDYLKEKEKQGLSLSEMRDSLEPESIEPHLYTSGLPEPDLIIRTSGEIRLSGFLLWQSAYAEYHFCDVFWPEFRRIDFLRALRDYHLRMRRFGK